ncbi:hypothetical protein [Bacillus salipaludis]|uniref:hypothetical protein n=1 Tax=Bacillus salipaludis TaxID=2547811 RepID=UPI002E209D74|nr:hypothetical protein [Bacillus salipaludis]
MKPSIEKSGWSNKREEKYLKKCLKLTFRFGDKIKTGNQAAYLLKSEKVIEIGKPVDTKTFWYETWLKLKSYYGE